MILQLSYITFYTSLTLLLPQTLAFLFATPAPQSFSRTEFPKSPFPLFHPFRASQFPFCFVLVVGRLTYVPLGAPVASALPRHRDVNNAKEKRKERKEKKRRTKKKRGNTKTWKNTRMNGRVYNAISSEEMQERHVKEIFSQVKVFKWNTSCCRVYRVRIHSLVRLDDCMDEQTSMMIGKHTRLTFQDAYENSKNRKRCVYSFLFFNL